MTTESVSEAWHLRAGQVLMGTVSEFDDDRGTGVVTAVGGRSWPFHCTELTDGTRTVEVGAKVVFTTADGHLGRVEARQIGCMR